MESGPKTDAVNVNGSEMVTLSVNVHPIESVTTKL